MKLEPNQIIDNRYKIIEHLGQGGMGAVWKAIDTKLDDEVVIKLPLNHLDNEILRRFGHEAKAMRKYSLDCPNILNIEDVGMLGEVPWYVMRYLPGGSARDQTVERDKKGNMLWSPGSFKWLTQIASALDYLHSRNCFHRDVKPENILFSGDGIPYLVDFGIVKNATETTTMMTEQGKVIGTLAYMAPEILEGGTFTAQSDQYALAVTLYESITGDRPFSGTTYFALFKSIQKGHPKLTELYSNAPEVASEVMDQALSAQPADRFESCGEFASRFIDGLSDTRAQGPSGGVVVTPAPPVKPTPAKTPGDVPAKEKKRLFEPPVEPKKADVEVPKRTWARWGVDLFVSLTIATATHLILAFMLEYMDLGYGLLLELLPVAVVVFASSLAVLSWKAKSSTREVWRGFLKWTTIVLINAIWAFLVLILTDILLTEVFGIYQQIRFWVGIFAFCVFCGSVFAIGKLTARSARDTFASFLASHCLALLALTISIYFGDPFFNTFHFVLFGGWLALLSAVLSFLWLQWKSTNAAFYTILTGVSGLLGFAIFFRCFYSSRSLTGDEGFGGSLLLLVPILLVSCIAFPFAIRRFAKSKLPSNESEAGGKARVRSLVQMAIVILSTIGLVVLWINSYQAVFTHYSEFGGFISYLFACPLLVAIWLFALLYRPVESSVTSGTVLDRFNFMRLRPKTTIAIVLTFAALFAAIKFDCSLTLTKAAANLGNTRSMLYLADRMENEFGRIELGNQEAFDLCRRAAESGSVAAQFQLAEIYSSHNHLGYAQPNTFEDKAEALRWYQKAAEQGHKTAEERAKALIAESN